MDACWRIMAGSWWGKTINESRPCRRHVGLCSTYHSIIYFCHSQPHRLQQHDSWRTDCLDEVGLGTARNFEKTEWEGIDFMLTEELSINTTLTMPLHLHICRRVLPSSFATQNTSFHFRCGIQWWTKWESSPSKAGRYWLGWDPWHGREGC